MVLVGTEVKSLREGKASLVDAFATIDDGEVWLRNLHIPTPKTRREHRVPRHHIRLSHFIKHLACMTNTPTLAIHTHQSGPDEHMTI